MTIVFPVKLRSLSGSFLITPGLSRVKSSGFRVRIGIENYQFFWRKGVRPNTPIS